MNPLVTLVVPTLNRPRYLRDTLSSVLAQDYPNLEILISDNGSTDETPALARSLAGNDPRVRFRRNDRTVPLREHFNQCAEAARGQFFTLLCDDDHISPNFVSALVGVATRHPSVNVVLPASIIIDEQGAVVRELPCPNGEAFDGPEFVCHWLYQREPKYFEMGGTVLARTAVMRHFGHYQPLARGLNIDNLLFLQYAISGQVGFARAAVFSWRVYASSHGVVATPEEAAQSSRHFVRHLQHDPRTVEALARLAPARRQEIIDGVRSMTAQEFLFRIKFYENPFGRAWLRHAFDFRFDAMFWLHVLRHYDYRLRMLFPFPARG